MVTADSTRLGIARCGIAAVLFGATTPIASRVADDTTAPILAGLLYLGAAIAVLPFVRRRQVDRMALRRGGRRLAVAVLAGGLVGPLLLAAGLSHTPAATASLLLNLELVATLRPPPEATATDYLYQPARPLNKITLFDFKTLDDNLGENPIGTSLERIDPLVGYYDAALNRLGEQDFFQKTVEQLLAEHPFDESRPPFALGDRTKGK